MRSALGGSTADLQMEESICRGHEPAPRPAAGVAQAVQNSLLDCVRRRPGGLDWTGRVESGRWADLWRPRNRATLPWILPCPRLDFHGDGLHLPSDGPPDQGVAVRSRPRARHSWTGSTGRFRPTALPRLLADGHGEIPPIREYRPRKLVVQFGPVRLPEDDSIDS